MLYSQEGPIENLLKYLHRSIQLDVVDIKKVKSRMTKVSSVFRQLQTVLASKVSKHSKISLLLPYVL